MPVPFPALTTPRLRLRPITDQDLPHIFKGLSHPDITKYYAVSFDSLEATRAQMTWFANLEKTGTGIWWAVCDRNNGDFLGAGGFNNLSREHQKAEIGFWLLPAHWGKGIMKETLPLICDYGIEMLALHRIEGFVEAENLNCKRAMAKLDFVHEGCMKDCEVKNGKFISLDIYALVR
ncbi:MAG: GNAT family N-acetyltransferase [Saprospiraceae bacterium]|nr:GNAT family N-acetyltransferase [Saprospiraceae bacterium]MCB9326702.1 GNAT family N-acetyltransferase [Lewinellaceae bacterium]